MKSEPYTLSKDDLKRIGQNVLFFNVPTFALTFLTAISQGMEPKQAALTASISFLTAIVDLMRKYKEGA